MGTIWLAYIVAAFAASALFVAAGWRSRMSTDAGFAGSAAWVSRRTPGTDQAVPAGAADAASSIDTALQRLHPLIRSQQAAINVAVEPGLVVRTRGEALTDITAELLALGVNAGLSGRFLLTASRHAGRVEISLSDDCAAEDAGLRRSQARTLAQHVALQGGSLEVMSQPRLGTTMTIRLPSAADAPSGTATSAAMPEPAAQLL